MVKARAQAGNSKRKKVASTARKLKSKAKKVLRTPKTKKLQKKVGKKLNNAKRSSKKFLKNAAHKAGDVQHEIMDYVKSNPIKSVSAVALTSLIAGFLYRNAR